MLLSLHNLRVDFQVQRYMWTNVAVWVEENLTCIDVLISVFLVNSADAERDVFNEKPSKEDIVAATQVKLSLFILPWLLWYIAVIYRRSWYERRMPRYYKSSVEVFNSISPKGLYFLSKILKIFGGIQQKYWYLF